MRHQQVVDRGHGYNRAVCGLQVPVRNGPDGFFVPGEFGELHVHHAFVLFEEGEERLIRRAGEAVLGLHVPVAAGLVPTVAHAALGHDGLQQDVREGERPVADAAFGHDRLQRVRVQVQELPAAVLGVLVFGQLVRPGEFARLYGGAFALELHQEGAVRVFFGVFQEVSRLLLVVVFFKEEMRHRQPERAVLPRMQRHPLVSEFGDGVEIRREDHALGAVMPGLGEEMRVRHARHGQVGAHYGDIFGIEPVGAFADVGLLAEDLGEGVGQVAIPVVEAEGNPAHELQVARPGGVAHHRHGRDRRETYQPVGAVLLHGIDIGGRYYFEDLVPAYAPEAALAPGPLVPGPFFLIALQGFPGLNRVAAVSRFLAPVEVEQRAPYQRELHPQRAVDIPGERGAFLAAARLVRGYFSRELRVIQGLGFPDHHAVLHMHVPGAAAGAVRAVRASHRFIVLEAVPVKLFPGPAFG